MLVIAGERWMQQPSVRRAWWLGVIIGVLAMIGRNHGLYGAGAGALLIGAVWLQPLAWRQRSSKQPAVRGIHGDDSTRVAA